MGKPKNQILYSYFTQTTGNYKMEVLKGKTKISCDLWFGQSKPSYVDLMCYENHRS